MNAEIDKPTSPEEILGKSEFFLQTAREDFIRAKSSLENIKKEGLSSEDKEVAKNLFITVRKSLQTVDYWTQNYGDDPKFKALLGETQSLVNELKTLEGEFGFDWDKFQQKSIDINKRKDAIRLNEGGDLILEQVADYDPESPEFEELIKRVFEGLKLERDALLAGVKKLTKDADMDIPLLKSLRDRSVAFGDFTSSMRVELSRYPKENELRINRLDAFLDEEDTHEMQKLLEELYDKFVSSEEGNKKEKLTFEAWKSDFIDRMIALDEQIDASGSNADVAATAELHKILHREFMSKIDEFSLGANKMNQFLVRFDSLSSKISSKEELVYVYDLEEVLVSIGERMIEDVYDPSQDIELLELLITEVVDSLGKINPIVSRGYKSKLMPDANELLKKILLIQEKIDEDSFELWKIDLGKDVDLKIVDFKADLTTATTQADLSTLIAEIEAYVETLLKLDFSSRTYSAMLTETESKVAILHSFITGVDQKLKDVMGAEAFEEDQKNVDAYAVSVESLEKSIKTILDGSFIANYTTEVDVLIKDLQDKFNIISASGIDKRVEGQSERVEAIRNKLFGGDSNGGEYSEAMRVLVDLREKNAGLMDYFEEQVTALNKNYLASVNSSTTTVISPNVDAMREIVEHQSEEFKNLLNFYYQFRDGYNPNTTTNTSNTLIYTRSARETRNAMVSFFNMKDLIAFRSMGEVIFNDVDGNPHKININDAVKKLEYYFKEVSWMVGERSHSYSKNGNPPRGMKYDDGTPILDGGGNQILFDDEGEPRNPILLDGGGNPELDGGGNPIFLDNDGNPILKIEERLVLDFPELKNMPSTVLESFKMFIVLSEMRQDSVIIDFAEYQASPIPEVQDFEYLRTISPVSKLMYDIQSSTFIDRNLGPFLLKLPSAGTIDLAYIGRWNLTNVPISFPKKHVGDEMQMQKGIDVVFPKSIRNEDNLVEAIQISEVLRTFLSPVEMPKVEMKSHLKILPSFYDIIKGEFDGKKLKRPEEMSLEMYGIITNDIEEFYKFVHGEFKPLKDIHDLDTHVGMMIAKIKMFKGIFGLINTKEDELFTPYVQLLMLTYLKKLFNSYKNLVKGEIAAEGASYFGIKHISDRSHSMLHRFTHLVGPMLTDSKTLPQHLVNPEAGTTAEASSRRHDVVGTIFKEINDGSGALRGAFQKFTKWGVFFDNDFETTPYEEVKQNLKSHHFYERVGIYARPTNLTADDAEKH